MRISPVIARLPLQLPLGAVPVGVDAEFAEAYERWNALGATDDAAESTTSTAATAKPGFMDGLKSWKSPLDAVSALKSSFQGDVTSNLPYVGGLAIPPLVVLMLLLGGGRRRFF